MAVINMQQMSGYENVRNFTVRSTRNGGTRALPC